jgi:NitT/TauT family transport system ATP-binding protein
MVDVTLETPLTAAAPDVVTGVQLEQVTFGYQTPILENFSWQLHPGETWAIVGASGIGKTTLLYLLAGLRKPQSGQVIYRGEVLEKTPPGVGLMLQDYGLLPWYRVDANVALGLKLRGVAKRERLARSRAWLERLGIDHLARRFPLQLSGGQRQRVALARLLVLEPDMMLLDEPLSALDELTRERLQKQLFSLTRDAQRTTVIVTHNIEEAALLASHVMVIAERTPISEVTVLPSPFAGEVMPRREEPHFLAFTRQIRDLLGL